MLLQARQELWVAVKEKHQTALGRPGGGLSGRGCCSCRNRRQKVSGEEGGVQGQQGVLMHGGLVPRWVLVYCAGLIVSLSLN